MKTSPTIATAVACAVSFLAIGLPLWRLPYAQVSLPNSLSVFGLVVVFAMALAIRAAFRASFVQAGILVGLCVPAAIMARIIVEVALDPTSHSLWPFEIVIGSGVGLALSCVGAVLGGLVAMAWNSDRAG